jgi:hypothetical protein
MAHSQWTEKWGKILQHMNKMVMSPENCNLINCILLDYANKSANNKIKLSSQQYYE